MIVVGPEDPLVKESTITSKTVGAKAYCRDRSFGSRSTTGRQQGVCQRLHDAPQHPDSPLQKHYFQNLEEGLAFLETLEAPYVLKADGALCRERSSHPSYAG